MYNTLNYFFPGNYLSDSNTRKFKYKRLIWFDLFAEI